MKPITDPKELFEDDIDFLEHCDGDPTRCPTFIPDLDEMEETGAVECLKCGVFMDAGVYKKWVKRGLSL